MTDHPQSDNRILFSQLNHCTLPFTTSSFSPTTRFEYHHLISLLIQSQSQLDTVAELLDCIISSKEQPNNSLLSIVKCNDKFDKSITIKRDHEDVVIAFMKRFDGLKERIEKDKVLIEEIALPLLRDGWKIVDRTDNALIVDISPYRLVPSITGNIPLPEVCTIEKDTPTIIEQRHLSMKITIGNETKIHSIHKVGASPNAFSPFHAYLWSKRDTLLQEMIFKQLIDEQIMEDRPLYDNGVLSIMIAGLILVQFSVTDDECKEEGVLGEVKNHFIRSKGQSCNWKEIREQLLKNNALINQ